jgi:hypothetical protein
MEAPTSKKTKEPPKRMNHKGNIKFPIKFPNLLLSREAYQIRVGEDHWVRSKPNSWKSKWFGSKFPIPEKKKRRFFLKEKKKIKIKK